MINNWLFILMISCILYIPALNASSDRRRKGRGRGGRSTDDGSNGGLSTGLGGAGVGVGIPGGGYTPCCTKSGGSDTELLLGILELFTGLEERITENTQLINDKISELQTRLDSAPIIPPFTAANYAICTGRPTPISGNATGNVSDSEDLRCGLNSEEIIGPDGQRDIGGNGILPGPFYSVEKFGGSEFTPPIIETCEQKCIETEGCLAYNWMIDNDDFNCELYDTDIANSGYTPVAIILCKLSSDTCTLGEIITYAGDVDNLSSLYRIANGDQVNEDDYPGICEILQNIYGDDGDEDPLTCLLPDLRGRFLAGVGEIGGTEFEIGEIGGTADLEFGVDAE